MANDFTSNPIWQKATKRDCFGIDPESVKVGTSILTPVETVLGKAIIWHYWTSNGWDCRAISPADAKKLAEEEKLSKILEELAKVS